MYSQPPAVALDFVFSRKLYVQPSAGFADFDLKADAQASMEFSPIPGVIASYCAAWNPQPKTKQSALAFLFQQAEKLDIFRAANSDQASVVLDDGLTARHGNAQPRPRTVASGWDDSAQAKGNTLQARYSDAPAKDIDGKIAAWETASVLADTSISSSFVVDTPWKDRQITEAFHSVSMYAKPWKKPENKPEPFGATQTGIASLEFYDRKNIRRADIYEIGSEWENVAIQPKEANWSMRHKRGPAKDRNESLPWGPSGYRDTTLEFVYPDYDGPIGAGETFIIPTLRFYIVANTAQIVRVSDGSDVPASAVTLSISTDQYTWSLSATLAGSSALALVEGTDGEPVEVDVIINGITWRVLLDGWGLTEAWAKKGGVVKGRSRSAYLADPYADSRDYMEGSGLNAQQLAAQELPPGWSLDWNMVDWFVPAGAWQYQGLSPVAAIAKIAAAGGGYVQPHLSSDTIIVNPLYPSAPWALGAAAPDFLMPKAIILQRNSQKAPGQGVNGVYVYGGTTGAVHTHVVRTGSDGLPGAPTVVDSLITDTAPARHRGIAAIAAGGRQSREVYELPLSAGLGGLIDVGSLIEIGEEVDAAFIGDWRGLVRAVSVSAGAVRAGNGGAALSVRQNIEIERHFDEGDV